MTCPRVAAHDLLNGAESDPRALGVPPLACAGIEIRGKSRAPRRRAICSGARMIPALRALPVTAVCAAALTTFGCGSRTALFGELGGSVSVGDAGGNPIDAGSPLDSAVHGSTCSIFRSRVFLSSTMHDGDFGGVRGADAECAARASAQRLGSAWRAWLSDTSTPAFAHIYAAPGGYVLLDGTVVASTFDALVSGSLAHAIDLTEQGVPITDGNTEVWTGIDLQGPSPNNGYCSDGAGNDWSTNDRNATFPFVGHSNKADATWTAVYLQFCNRTNVRLYCFEACD